MNMIDDRELTVGEKIKFFRQRMCRSQLEVELDTGLGNGTMSRIERGITNPTKETIIKIASSLSLNPKETGYLFNINLYSEVT